LGITDPAAAEQYIKEQEQYRQQTYKEPETWGEAPITKGLGLLGQSLPYMVAPIAAGYAAPAGLAALGAASVPAGLAALGAAGATSGAQFTGSFLTRQMEEGKKLEDTNLGYAAAAAVPAAALDLISLKMFPVVRNIFAAAGKEVSEKALLEATKQTTAKIAQDYALTTGKTMGTEGLTEVGQQVLERLQAGLAIDDAKARSEYFDSFVGGAVLGGALAPAGRYIERSQEQGKQKAAEKAEQARLADEIRAVQAAEDAQRQQEAAAIQAREGAMEKARNMPGFTGVTDPNEAFLARSREQQEAAAQAAEQARQAQVAEVQNTVFHADPMENQRRKDAELAKLNALPAPQEPAPPIQVITPEQQEQEKVAAIQERMAETPAFTGGPGNANELMMQLSRLAKTEKSQQEKIDLQTKVDAIRNTEFSADPTQNVMLQQKELENLGFMPYVPIEMQLGMMPEGTPPAPLKPPPKADVTPENQLQLAEQPAPAEVPAIPAIPAAPAAVPTATVPATAPAKPVEPMDERQKILSQRVDAVATMVRLREANKGNIPSPRSKAGQEYVEAQQRAKELTIRLMSKEAPEFQEATPTVGEPMPVSQEFEAETKDLLKQSKAATADINKAKRESYSLWQSLRGTLQPSEVNDISPDKEYKLLRAKAGTRGAVLDDIVADGKLDDFLPYDNRHDSPNFDLTDAVEHVKEKLRTKNYMTEDTNRALEILGRHKEEIEKQIELHLGLKDINYELQLAADEQRAIDQAAKAAPAQGEDAVAAPSEEQVAPEEELKLTQPTAEGIRAKEVETEKRAADEEKKAKEAEAKAKADKEVGEFTLTGSDRAADLASAQGQTDIFAAPEPKKAEPKVEPKKELPPELPIPADYKPIAERHPQVVMAARELAAGRMSKAQYDKYVDAYKPIAEVERPEPPQTTEGMAKVLNTTQREKINPSIPAGTKVGLRMDINALKRGKKLGLNGSVVAIHPENNPKSPIGYASTGHLTNVKFAIRSEAAAMKIAMGEETKMPQQTAEGSWVPTASGKVYSDVLRLLKDPAWTQVSFDPLRHSYFYDRKNAKPVLSADEVYQVGRFLLAKNVKYGEREDFMYMKDKIERDATPEQEQRADGHAQDFGGDIVYQRDGLALIRAFNAWNGKPVYIPVKDGLRAKVDIEAFTGSGISKADVKELTDAKKKWVAAEEEKAKNEPFVKYNNDGVAFSQSVPADFAGVIGEWKKMLGLKPNVYITTVDDARANRLNLIGDFASVAGSTLDPAAVGVMQRLPNGDYFIAYTKKISRVRMLETAAHELGHIHEMEVFNNQDAATKEAIKDEYYSWLEQQKTATARDLVNTLRARATAKGTQVADGKMAADLRAYWRSFSEWYADQVSKWATTQEKPLSVVEKFFAKLGAAMKAFYNKLRNGKYLPNQTFIKYMDRVTEAAVDSADRPFNKEPLASNQMEMQFMLGSIKEKAQQVLQKRTPMDESAFAGLDGDTIADLNKMFYTPNKTILDRMDSNKGKLFQWIAQKTVDEFRTAKEYSPIGHMQATLSKDTGGALENLLFHGHVTMNQGALDVIADGNRKGFIDSVKPLGKELDRWQIWMALSREANLPDSKRSSRLDDLVAKRDDFVKGDMDGRSRLEVYEQARKDVMALNKSVLNVALMNGLIDREAYQRFSNDMFYIPFYRAMEDGQLESVRTASRLSNQQFSKMLKGENEKPFGDLMENTLRNWSHILSASMKNLASNTILTDARDMGAVEPALKPGLAWVDGKVVNAKTGNIVGNGELVQMREDADGQEKLVAMTESKKGATDLVHTQVDGVTTYHHIIDPLLLESVGKITELGPRGLAVDIMRPFKDLLRFGVTASPTFKAYNLIRESIQSAALSDLSGNLVKNVYSGLYDSGKDSPIYRSALAGGGVFNFGSVLEGDRSEAVKKLISRGVDATTILDTPEKVKSMFTTMWRHYEDLGNKAENANRIALYKQLMEQGATHLEASFKARDLINFTAMGSSNAIRFVSATVPFFNARLQGLYKLGRDGVLPTSRVFYNTITGKELDQTDVQRAKSFTAVTGAVALASIALYMANKDDEDFQKREQWDRDAFWWAKIPGTDIAIRVPKPFETGAIATLVERTVEQMMDKDVETKRFTDSLSRMVWQTFSMNPVPQFVKPLIDIYANKNPFTSAPIESAGMERLTKQERKTDSTSPIAIALGGVSNAMSQVTGGSTELSPIQIDYMIRAYMGWLGGTIAASTTQAIRPFNDGVYPSMDYTKTLALGFVEKLPTAQSTYMTDFYQNNVKIQQAYADMRHFAELQQSEKVLEILKEKRSEIAMSKFYDKTAKNLANIRQRIQMISNPAYKGMTSEQKEEEIKRLKQIMSMAAKQAEDARKQLKNQLAP
jgi:hypothetical protein